MTPLEAFREDVATLLASYKSGAISYDEAAFEYGQRGDLMLQGYVMDSPPDEALAALFENFAELRMLACEHGDIAPDDALVDINDQALALYPQPQERFRHTNPVQAEFLYRIPSPEAA